MGKYSKLNMCRDLEPVEQPSLNRDKQTEELFKQVR